MSLIQGVIPRQGFEIIRDRICEILVDEFAGQFILSGDADLESMKVYMERMIPFDHTELPALNVGIERGDYQSYHQGQSEAVYRFFIEANTFGETDDDFRGDTLAKVTVHKIIGIARAILENPVYKTLGFQAGQLISHRHIESFVFAESTRQDAENVTMARMILVVKCVETTELIEADLISNWNTTVKLYDTNKGYYWSRDEIENVFYEDGEVVEYEDGADLVYE